MVRIDIIGTTIRQHLHLRSGDPMPPIITISRPYGSCSCMGMHLAGPVRICYDSSAPEKDEAGIETIWLILHYDWPIIPLRRGGRSLHSVDSVMRDGDHSRRCRPVRSNSDLRRKTYHLLPLRRVTGLALNHWVSRSTFVGARSHTSRGGHTATLRGFGFRIWESIDEMVAFQIHCLNMANRRGTLTYLGGQ